MHSIKIKTLLNMLHAGDIRFEEEFVLPFQKKLLDKKGEELLAEAFRILGGKGEPVYLPQLKFDFKIDRFLFLYDEENHFNRYRLKTFSTAAYDIFTFAWLDSYKRLCRTYERDCLKVGMQERIWSGPPIASKCFGVPEEAGDLSGNGAPGWKLNAYNDVQYDVITRLSGYKMVRLPMYENLMVSGSLKSINQLLMSPKEETRSAIVNWITRKLV
ncbi:MAG TPA: hypothetical protein VK014_06805 [Cyclobacteriaceae bacterium]|nr:hypothetical protein [Cyclobacteriaceae bacterium]